MGTFTQTPVALWTACEIAAGAAAIGASPAERAPNGPDRVVVLVRRRVFVDADGQSVMRRTL